MEEVTNEIKTLAKPKRRKPDTRLKISFNDEDKNELKAQADKAGFKSVSSYIRTIIRTYIYKRSNIKIIIQPEINLITSRLLRYTSNNLNQLMNEIHKLKIAGDRIDDNMLLMVQGQLDSIKLLIDKLNNETKGFNSKG